MKNWMIAAACLMAGAVSAELLVGWDGSGISNTAIATNTTLNVGGILGGAAMDSKGSNDGFFGPDSEVAGGVAGASTTVQGGWHIKQGQVVDVRIDNTSGQNLELDTLLFDYLAISYDFSPLEVQVSYHSGHLDDADGTLLTTFDTSSGNSPGGGLRDFNDYVVDLQVELTDYTLANGEFARFTIAGIGPNTGNGSLDNIAFTGSVIPEPATLGLVCMVSGGLLFVRRRFCM